MDKVNLTLKENLNLIHKFHINYYTVENSDDLSPPSKFFSTYFYENNDVKFKKKLEIDFKKFLKLQRKDGFYDEWYKNERSFCATAFAGMFLTEKLINNDFINKFDEEITLNIKKIYSSIKNKHNKWILNQNFAKLLFLNNLLILSKKYPLKFNINSEEINTNIIKLDRIIKSEFIDKFSFEYGGIDLGYLSISLKILVKINIINNGNYLNLIDLFIQIFRKYTSDFYYFPNYIFSRSSRIFLISGFYYSYTKKLITKDEYQRIYLFYKHNINNFFVREEFKYLSFFFIPDLYFFNNLILQKFNKVHLNLNHNIYKKKLNFENPNKLIKLHIKNFTIFNYKVNCNINAIYYKKIFKYIFNFNIKMKNKLFSPNIFISTNHFDSDSYRIKSSFSKYLDEKKYIKYVKIMSFISSIKFISIFLNNLIKKIFIIDRSLIIAKYYCDIKFLNNFIIYKATIISKNKYEIFENYKSNFFSPTSFINDNEIIKHTKINVVTFKKKSLYVSVIKSKLLINE